MTGTLSAALAYAALGWPVFPCAPGRKEPLTAQGFHDASTDPQLIEAWWARWPAANVAVATGAPGPDVVDFDVKDGQPGLTTYRRLRDAGLLRGAFAAVVTPSKGRHLYYAGSEQGCGSLRGHGVDFKARGGYVLAPPSRTAAGAYRMVEHRWGERPVDWTAIRVYIDPPRPAPAAGIRPGDDSALVRHVEQLQPGNRNAGLYWAACCAAESGAGPDVYWALVAAAVSAGLGELEARRTVESAHRRAA